MTQRPMNLVMRCRRGAVAAFAGASIVLAAGTAVAAEPIAAIAQQPLRDPWVPPEARHPSLTPPPSGAALRAAVERKLRQAFDEADVAHTGSLTRDQARTSGLGFVARHFDEIDRQRRGAVRFDDVKRYMVERGAKLD
ncbi:MAG TPA: EF-hand domain-containing protein [Casimicrobiaceae bacterium]|nr:EF-hand domain-containing protein [Casimicrobiaceae bacterium]